MRVDDLFFLNLFAVFAVSINALLIFLIIFKSPKSLGSYKYLMIYIAFFELTYAILYVLEKPELFTKESGFFLLVNWKTSMFPKLLSCALDLLFGGFFGISLGILALHFYYRFLSITGSPRINSFSTWKIVPWFSLPILSGTIFMTAGGVFMCADEAGDRYLRENYPPLLENITSIDDLYYVGPFFWPQLENSDKEQYFSWKSARASLIVMGLISTSISIMIYFGVKGFQRMQHLIDHTSQSEKFRSIQSQLFRALVFQTLIPVFLMHIPASSIYATTFFNCSTEIVGQILGLTIAMYPALNPLPTIFIVKNYKNALMVACIDLKNAMLCKTRVHALHSTTNSTIVTASQRSNLPTTEMFTRHE